MGSGGLRGLQILRSGAIRVRGGFDSHAFPPALPGIPSATASGIFALVIVLSLGAPAASAPGIAPPAFASAETDSAPPPETGVVEFGRVTVPPATGETAGDTSATRRTPAPRKHSEFDQPRWVMARSLVIPGWGQLHNGSWIKAAGVATVEGVLIGRMVNDNQALGDLNREIEAARANGDPAAEAVAIEAYNSRLNDLTRRQWLFAAALIYALLDAYIDAHFRDFDIEFRQDPALPGGVPPTDGKHKGRATSGEFRLELRRSF